MKWNPKCYSLQNIFSDTATGEFEGMCLLKCFLTHYNNVVRCKSKNVLFGQYSTPHWTLLSLLVVVSICSMKAYWESNSWWTSVACYLEIEDDMILTFVGILLEWVAVKGPGPSPHDPRSQTGWRGSGPQADPQLVQGHPSESWQHPRPRSLSLCRCVDWTNWNEIDFVKDF